MNILYNYMLENGLLIWSCIKWPFPYQCNFLLTLTNVYISRSIFSSEKCLSASAHAGPTCKDIQAEAETGWSKILTTYGQAQPPQQTAVRCSKEGARTFRAARPNDICSMYSRKNTAQFKKDNFKFKLMCRKNKNNFSWWLQKEYTCSLFANTDSIYSYSY